MKDYVAEPWEGYELIQTLDGKRLERVADFVIERPEPAAIWGSGDSIDQRWKGPDAAFRSGEWDVRRAAETLENGWKVTWKGIPFTARLTSFRHIGFFPEQSVNWEWIQELVSRAVSSGKPVRVLNLFGYTGVISSVAARAGAQVCHVDASKTAVRWAGENARMAGVPGDKIRWIVDDVRKFVAREIRRGSKYNIIVMDPPVFGRGTKGEVWRLSSGLSQLFSDVTELFSDRPLGFLCNFYATELYPASVLRCAEQAMRGTVGLDIELSSLSLRESCNENVLQTGYMLRS